jgi:phosphate transport system substrate-binding protein
MKFIVFLLISFSFNAYAENQNYEKETLRITGSASVYPVISFISDNLDNFAENPIIESVGTGAGFDSFCKSSFNSNSPDIVNASREITPKEIENCAKHDIKKLSRMTLGLDGIIISFQTKDTQFKGINLTIRDLFFAFGRYIPVNGKVEKNKYVTWKEVRSDLPDTKITLYGPPSTSGTYDFFIEVLQKYCLSLPEMKEHFKDKAKENCRIIRPNETYVAVTDQDSIIARKVDQQKGVLGLLRYGFFKNSGKFSAIQIEGVLPTEENIVAGKYKIARPLFIYYNPNSVSKVKGMKSFLTEIAKFSYADLITENNPYIQNPERENLIVAFIKNKSECNTNKEIIGFKERCGK